MNLFYKLALILLTVGASSKISAQEAAPVVDTIYNPDIIYSPIPKSYEIAGIKVEGINHVDDYIIIANSGLSIGERV